MKELSFLILHGNNNVSITVKPGPVDVFIKIIDTFNEIYILFMEMHLLRSWLPLMWKQADFRTPDQTVPIYKYLVVIIFGSKIIHNISIYLLVFSQNIVINIFYKME